MEEKILFYDEIPLDFDLINKTFNRAFKKNLDQNYWEWRFKHNPNGKIYINYIKKDDTLVSYYAVSPCLINIDGSPAKVALSNMTMTHPDFTGNGYFNTLAKSMYNRLKRDEFIGVIGFANTNSHYAFRKYLNWQDLSPLFLLTLDKNSMRKIKSKINDVEIVVKKANITDLKNIIKLKCSNEEIFIVNRDFQSLKWRIIDNPVNDYFFINILVEGKFIGASIFKTYNNQIDIMEIFYSDQYSQQDVLLQIINKLNDKKINIWSNIYSSEYLNLEKLGFQPKDFITYFGIIPFQNNSSLLDISNWHYRFIDSDVF